MEGFHPLCQCQCQCQCECECECEYQYRYCIYINVYIYKIAVFFLAILLDGLMVGTIVLVGLKYGGKPNSEMWRRRRGGKRVNNFQNKGTLHNLSSKFQRRVNNPP